MNIKRKDIKEKYIKDNSSNPIRLMHTSVKETRMQYSIILEI